MQSDKRTDRFFVTHCFTFRYVGFHFHLILIDLRNIYVMNLRILKDFENRKVLTIELIPIKYLYYLIVYRHIISKLKMTGSLILNPIAFFAIWDIFYRYTKLWNGINFRNWKWTITISKERSVRGTGIVNGRATRTQRGIENLMFKFW